MRHHTTSNVATLVRVDPRDRAWVALQIIDHLERHRVEGHYDGVHLVVGTERIDVQSIAASLMDTPRHAWSDKLVPFANRLVRRHAAPRRSLPLGGLRADTPAPATNQVPLGSPHQLTTTARSTTLREALDRVGAQPAADVSQRQGAPRPLNLPAEPAAMPAAATPRSPAATAPKPAEPTIAVPTKPTALTVADPAKPIEPAVERLQLGTPQPLLPPVETPSVREPVPERAPASAPAPAPPELQLQPPPPPQPQPQPQVFDDAAHEAEVVTSSEPESTTGATLADALAQLTVRIVDVDVTGDIEAAMLLPSIIPGTACALTVDDGWVTAADLENWGIDLHMATDVAERRLRDDAKPDVELVIVEPSVGLFVLERDAPDIAAAICFLEQHVPLRQDQQAWIALGGDHVAFVSVDDEANPRTMRLLIDGAVDEYHRRGGRLRPALYRWSAGHLEPVVTGLDRAAGRLAVRARFAEDLATG